jgi:ABC-type dipeptide/oligopeptide/nickel transport system permease subunit
LVDTQHSLVIADYFGSPGKLWQVFVAAKHQMWVEVARVVRGQVIKLSKEIHVTAARALGFAISGLYSIISTEYYGTYNNIAQNLRRRY